MEQKRIIVTLPLMVWREEERFVAWTPALELSSCGSSEDEALKNFDEAVELFFETTLERNALKDVLEGLGWSISQTDARPPSAPLPNDRAYQASIPLPLAQ